jgi:hypothetical protein
MGFGDRRSGTIVPFGRLSPVSETDSESLHTDASSDLRPRPLNFSRPRPVDLPSSRSIPQDGGSIHTTSSSSSGSSNVRSIKAFHEPDDELPDEPRFELDLDTPETPNEAETPSSAASEFAWGGQLGGLRTRPRLDDYDQQRSFTIRGGTPVQSKTHSSDSTVTGLDQPLVAPQQPSVAELYGSEPTSQPVSQQSTCEMPPPPVPPQKQPRIVRRTSVDQQSERMSINSTASSSVPDRRACEDGASHHTLSVNGDAGAGQLSGLQKFNSSNHDISMLSEKEIAKLKKKGINPQLYMEMKAARKGKSKWVGPLVGNTYIG